MAVTTIYSQPQFPQPWIFEEKPSQVIKALENEAERYSIDGIFIPTLSKRQEQIRELKNLKDLEEGYNREIVECKKLGHCVVQLKIIKFQHELINNEAIENSTLCVNCLSKRTHQLLHMAKKYLLEIMEPDVSIKCGVSSKTKLRLPSEEFQDRYCEYDFNFKDLAIQRMLTSTRNKNAESILSLYKHEMSDIGGIIPTIGSRESYFQEYLHFPSSQSILLKEMFFPMHTIMGENIKRLTIENLVPMELLQEIEMRHKLNNSPYFTKYYGHHVDHDNNSNFGTIWMEPMNGTLMEYKNFIINNNNRMNREKIFFDEEIFGYTVAVILNAITEIDNKNLRDFDIALANIFVNWKGEIKIGDFENITLRTKLIDVKTSELSRIEGKDFYDQIIINLNVLKSCKRIKNLSEIFEDLVQITKDDNMLISTFMETMRSDSITDIHLTKLKNTDLYNKYHAFTRSDCMQKFVDQYEKSFDYFIKEIENTITQVKYMPLNSNKQLNVLLEKMISLFFDAILRMYDSNVETKAELIKLCHDELNEDYGMLEIFLSNFEQEIKNSDQDSDESYSICMKRSGVEFLMELIETNSGSITNLHQLLNNTDMTLSQWCKDGMRTIYYEQIPEVIEPQLSKHWWWCFYSAEDAESNSAEDDESLKKLQV